MAGKTTLQRGMEEAPENGKESSHSTCANGMNECFFFLSQISGFSVDYKLKIVTV